MRTDLPSRIPSPIQCAKKKTRKAPFGGRLLDAAYMAQSKEACKQARQLSLSPWVLCVLLHGPAVSWPAGTRFLPGGCQEAFFFTVRIPHRPVRSLPSAPRPGGRLPGSRLFVAVAPAAVACFNFRRLKFRRRRCGHAHGPALRRHVHHHFVFFVESTLLVFDHLLITRRPHLGRLNARGHHTKAAEVIGAAVEWPIE